MAEVEVEHFPHLREVFQGRLVLLREAHLPTWPPIPMPLLPPEQAKPRGRDSINQFCLPDKLVVRRRLPH